MFYKNLTCRTYFQYNISKKNCQPQEHNILIDPMIFSMFLEFQIANTPSD